MVCETLARYGCASTAMCYVMHMSAVATIMLRPTPELVDKYIRPLGECKIGTLSYSDPETGSHFWYPFSSKAERSNGGYKVNKKASWTTSGGFADFYVVQTTSPDFKGYDDLSVFVIDGEHVKAQPSLWDALGLRGNQSGPIQVEDVEIPGEQIVGPVGDGATSNDEAVDPWFLIGSSSVWNGITMGAIDIAKRHTTRKRHVDVGMRVADYPTIQDYVGEAVMDTNACRVFVMSVAQAMDRVTDDNRRVLEVGETARADYLHWAWQIKFEAAKNTAHHVDKMLHACGGSGYKRDMELERYVRDAKAGWVMGPTNEVLRQFVGKAVLLGFDALDYWNQTYNRRVVENEVKKLDAAGKRELAKQLSEQADKDEAQGAGGEGVTRIRQPAVHGGRCASPVGSRLRPSTARSSRGGCGRARRRWWSCTRRPRDGDRPRRRPARRADGACAGRAATTPVRSAWPPTPRPACCGAWWRAAPTTASWACCTRAGCARTTPGRCGCSARTARPGASESFDVRARRAAGGGRARRARGGRRPAGLGAGRSSSSGPRPRPAAELELPPPLAEPRLDFRVDRASALAYEVREGEFIQIIDVQGKQCSDFLAFHEHKLAEGARARPGRRDHAHADGRGGARAGDLQQVLRRRHGPAGGGGARHGRPPRHVRARLPGRSTTRTWATPAT